jgi:phosphotransferase system enzyme I (PtsI)
MAKRRTFYFDGLGVSGGVILGPAYVLEEHGMEAEGQQLDPQEIEREVEVLHRSTALAVAEVQELGRAVAEKLDAQQAAIFDAHVTLLGDPLLIERTEERIRREMKNAEYILWVVTKDIGEQLATLGDAYFAERSHDLFDVARRVIKFIRQIKNPTGSQIPSGSIVVANDLGPSETAALRRDHVSAFCTNAGGPTSHTAIMAKALGLPAVVGLDYITHYVRTGDSLIVDGTEGTVILNPSEDQIAYYRQQAAAYQQQKVELAELSMVPAVTTDGVEIRLEANIEFDLELEAVSRENAEGIGLFRTEYLFIERDTLPSEDEQEQAYRHVLESMGDRPVVFRTLDVGGDKLSNTLPTPVESNPFLGLRALRLCLAFPELFRSQLRPLMRAASGRQLNILLPMVSGLEEIQLAKAIIGEVHDQLATRGIPLPHQIRIGAMIEIPSAAIEARTLAGAVDFFSIGTNDLTQYTLAVDRVNKMVGHLYHECHPAVLRLIRNVVEAAHERGIPVAVCGEMAGNVQQAMILVGLGVRTLSMSPSQIGRVKKALRSLDMAGLESMTKRMLRSATAAEVKEELARHLRHVALGSSEENPL